MGCGSSSGPGSTTNTQQTTTPPASVLNAYQGLINQGTQVAQQPLQQYQGPVIAGFNPTQQAAFSEVNQAQGAALPYLNAAQTYLGAGATPVMNSVQSFSPLSLTQYQDPYTQQVTQATENLFNQQNAQQFNQADASAAAAGAFGGDRQAVLEAQMAQQQQLAEAPTLANIQNQGFTGAEQELNTQQNLQLQGASASDWLAQNAAGLESGLGTTAQNSLLSGANAELGAGNQEQSLQQQELNVPLAEFQQQQAYPFQVTNYLAGLVEGAGPGEGGTATTTTPGANWIGQLGGLALSGAGALENSGLFGNGSTAGFSPSSLSSVTAGSSPVYLNDALQMAEARGGRINDTHSVLSWPRRDVGGLVPGGGGFPSLGGDDAAEVNQAMSLLDASPVGAPSTDHATLSVPQPSMGGSGASNGASSSSSSALGAVASLAPLALALLARGGGARGFPHAFADTDPTGNVGGSDSDSEGPSPALGQDPGDLGDLQVSAQSPGVSPPVPAGIDMNAAASHGAASPDAGFPSATSASAQGFPRLIQGQQATPDEAAHGIAGWLANPLTQIGIGMMTSRSPALLGNIGEGLQAGARAVNQQQQMALAKQKASQPHVDSSGSTMKLVYPDGTVLDTGLGTHAAELRRRTALDEPLRRLQLAQSLQNG
jgi:hypothetical protein